MPHWTYATVNPGDHLHQGDLIHRSDELLEVLSQVHGFFCDERYLSFAILTQTCDLVRRSGRCKAEYIQLAVIRELDSLLPRILNELCGIGSTSVFKKEGKYFAQQSLQKILNQNDQARGLFYLHPDADVGVAAPSVIMLRISIALKRDHYELLLRARRGRLCTEYSNKLGWLSGNLYSRIATPDWEDQLNDKGASATLAKEYLAGVTKDDNWVPLAWIEAAKAAGVDPTKMPTGDFLSRVRQYAQPEPLDLVLKRAEDVLRIIVTEQLATVIKGQIATADMLVDLVLPRIVDLVRRNISSCEINSLDDKLRNDTVFCLAIKNHAASLIKTHLKTPDNQGIDIACEGLQNSKGFIVPAIKQLQAHLLSLLPPENQDSVDRAIALTSEFQLFDVDAAQAVKQIAINALNSLGADIIAPFVKRLKNDISLRALLRKLEDASHGSAFAED